jgi:hypothetical protein
MQTFKLRASAAGKLMTNPTSAAAKAGATLSETSKTYLKEWLTTEIYGVQKEIKSKYIDKGNICEDEAIDKAVEWLDLPFAMKNETSFEDDYFTGTPDLITNGVVYDIKNSWDCHTFPLFEPEIPTKDYFYQLQVYMHLTGARKAVLCYLLMNTPEAITWETPHDYSGMDKKYRIKTYQVHYDAEVIVTLQARVLAARDYISELLKTIEI